MIRNKIIAVFVATALTTTVNAAEIMIDEVKFEGTAEAVAKYREARNAVEAADKHYANIRKRYTKNMATIQDYCVAQKSFAAVSEKMHLLESDLEMVPSIYPNNLSDMKPEEKRQLYAEARKISDLLPIIKSKCSDIGTYEQWLKNMLPTFRSHPGEGIILFALGGLNESSYKSAVFYYTAVTRCPFPSDEWGFAQQAAWKRLAVLHEKNHAYQKAIEALQNWRISEPCGTGAASSEIGRQFEIWRLSMYRRNKEEIRTEMWSAITTGKIPFGFATNEELAEHVLSLYLQDDLDTLSEQLPRERKKIEEIDSDDLNVQIIKKEFPKFASALEMAIEKKKIKQDASTDVDNTHR